MVVVGAGAAGCVVARRLLDRGASVLLVDAGPRIPSPAITTRDALVALDDPAWSWPDVTARFTRGDGAEAIADYRRGRGLGGSTAINTLVAAPGDRADYDRWRSAFGCGGLDADTIAPALHRASATMHPQPAEQGPLARAVGEAAASVGHRVGGRSDELDATGFLVADLFLGDGWRRSAADAYLGDRLDPTQPSAGGLEIACGVGVARLVVERGSVTGVGLDDGRVMSADRVVVSAGALASPRLLARSGIGSASVGSTAEDHPSFTFTIDLRQEAQLTTARPIPPVSAMLRWSSGEHRSASTDLAALVLDHVGVGPARRYGAIVVMLTDVTSRGTVELEDRPAGPNDNQPFTPGWLRTDDDLDRFRRGVRHIAALLREPSLTEVADAVYIDDAGTPLDALDSMTDEALGRWLRSHPGPVSHLASTIPLGQNGPIGDGGAVDGHPGLHVIDASLIPHLPTGNPQMPVLAVAEWLAPQIGR